MTNLPIQLWNCIINPSVVYPFDDICIEIIIVLKTACTASFWVVRFITIDAERTHSKFHPWLDPMDRCVELLYQQVNLIASPITTIAEALGISLLLYVIRNIHSCHRIRIEIVIDMKSVDIVTFHDVLNYFTDIITILLKSRIHHH